MHYLHTELYELIKTDTAIFDFIQTSSLDGLWYWDLENPTEEWMNPKFWTTLGYDPANMPHKAEAWKDIIHPEDFKLAVKEAEKHIADLNYIFDVEIRYTHKNGSIVWIQCRGMAIRDEQGKAIRMLGTHNNITNLKRNQNLLQEANRAAKVGIWEIDLDNEQLYWSDITKEIHEVPLDFEPNLATGINFYKEGESRDMITACVNKAMADGTPWDVELQLVTAKQNEIWVRAIGQAEFNNGKCARVYGVFQDIDEQKKGKIALTKERTFLKTLIDYLPVNVYVKDSLSRKTLVNQMELDHMGFSDIAQVIGRKESELYPLESVKLSRAEDLAVLQTGQPMLNQETINIKKDGTQTWFLTSKIPLKNEEGKVDSLLGISYNITKHKEAEEKIRKYSILAAKSKEMEQFAYIASHDLREPLTTIKGYLTLLKEEFLTQMPKDAQDILQFTIERTNRMDELIHGLLDYSRLSQVKELEMVDCNKTLEDVLADLSVTIQKQAVQFDLQSLPTLSAYPLELKLLFQNLISNAIKFRKQEVAPKICIHCEPIQKGWQFKVKDNGIGIEESQKDRIFYIFQRLHKEGYDGTGIGLANCKKIVELHNGEIWVESKLGEGSTFYFTIKIERE